MTVRYRPSSVFLQSVVDETISCGEGGNEANLVRLMTLTRDADVANRDWATFLLAQLALDRPDVRAALIASAQDDVAVMRAEAILGLACLDPGLALPFLHQALAGKEATHALFEAAELVADPSLVEGLMAFAAPSDDAWLDKAVWHAVEACSRSG